MQQRTFTLKKKDLEKKWVIIDARNLVLGRLAARVAVLLRGKHKACYTPSMDCGDNVVLVNARHITLTGNKYNDAIMHYHTGYPGGLKTRTMRQRLEGKRPEQVVMRAISRMIPSGPLRIQQMRNLKVYLDESHPHQAQAPEVYDCSDIRRC